MFKVYNRKENSALKWQLLHTIALAMDCMCLLMCFSLSQVFLDHIFAAETHGELSIYFLFLFFFALRIERGTIESKCGGIIIINDVFLLIGHHNKSDSPSVLNEMC